MNKKKLFLYIPPLASLLLMIFWCPLLRSAEKQTPPHALIIISSEENAQALRKGDLALASQNATPASLTKIVLAWAALESGVITTNSRIRCNDKFIEGTPRDLTLAEALKLSSNDFFVETTRRLGAQKSRDYIIQSGFFSEVPPADWPGEKIEDIVHGGGLQTRPINVSLFIRDRLLGKGLSKNQEINRQLLDSLYWETLESGIKLYGKTGTYSGAAWFAGFYIEKGQTNVFTSFVPYAVPQWKPARALALSLVIDHLEKSSD